MLELCHVLSPQSSVLSPQSSGRQSAVKAKKAGFSLVELSIVLVILGLLTGGILTGQSLIRAAELRSVTTDYQRYVTAAQTFRDKYFAIPGDMTNAVAFWGDNASLCADASITDGSPGACNGNGNGKLNQNNEMYQFWSQMALSGLIEGTYSGEYASGGNWGQPQIGVSIPSAKISNVGFSAFYADESFGYFPGAGEIFVMNYGNSFMVGAERNTFLNQTAFLTTEEAWNIDKKIDDGKPGYGKVIGINWNNYCSRALDGGHAYDDFDAEYRLDQSGQRCALIFRDLF